MLAGCGRGHLDGCTEDFRGDDLVCLFASERPELTQRDVAFVLGDEGDP